MNHDYLIKFILLGDTNVGKTAILERFTQNRFRPSIQPTVGVDFGTKTVRIDEKDILIMAWDTCGSENFRSITRTYYRGSAVVFLVYDITSRTSFRNLEDWLHDIQINCENPNLSIILVGNKSDCSFSRQVSLEEGEAFWQKNHPVISAFFETSARSAENVEELFLSTAVSFYSKVQAGEVEIADNDDGQGITLGPRQLRAKHRCFQC